MPGKRLTDDERQRIVDLLATGKSCRDIAAEVGRSPNTVSAISQEIGHRFGQSNASRAHEARSGYAAERRAEAASAAQDVVERVLGSFFDERSVPVSTRDGVEFVMAEPDARALRDLASTVHTLTRTVLDIDRHDNRNDEGLAAVDAWLRNIAGAG